GEIVESLEGVVDLDDGRVLRDRGQLVTAVHQRSAGTTGEGVREESVAVGRGTGEGEEHLAAAHLAGVDGGAGALPPRVARGEPAVDRARDLSDGQASQSAPPGLSQSHRNRRTAACGRR